MNWITVKEVVKVLKVFWDVEEFYEKVVSWSWEHRYSRLDLVDIIRSEFIILEMSLVPLWNLKK